MIFNDTTTAYVGAGYHGTTQRVAVPIAGTLRPRELLSTTYAKAGVWGTRQQESAKIIGILRPKDHKAATYAPVGCAAIRMQMTAYVKGNIRRRITRQQPWLRQALLHTGSKLKSELEA